MLTERHKEFMDYVVLIYSVLTTQRGYEFKDVKIPWKELLILNEITV